MYGKVQIESHGYCTLIMSLSGQHQRHCGSKQHLVVKGDFGFEQSIMFGVGHLPNSNIIQQRRRTMCQQINDTLEQQIREEIMPIYPVYFPHGLDFMTGGNMYMETIPRWWYRLSDQSPPAIVKLGPCTEMLPIEAEMVLLSLIDRPANYTQCSRAQWQVASEHWWIVVQELHRQFFRPARRINWWGWNLTTDGPPAVFSPSRVFDPENDEDYEAMARRSITPTVNYVMDDEFEVSTTALMQVSLPTEVAEMTRLGYESDEWVFWRAAQLALEAGLRDSEELGWPRPIGIRGSPAGFRLIFDEDNDNWSDTTLSQNGTEDSV